MACCLLQIRLLSNKVIYKIKMKEKKVKEFSHFYKYE